VVARSRAALPVVARCEAASPGTARWPGAVARPGVVRPGVALPGTARWPGAVARPGVVRPGVALPGTARWPGAVARPGVTLPGTAQWLPTGDRRMKAGLVPRRRVGPRGVGAEFPARPRPVGALPALVLVRREGPPAGPRLRAHVVAGRHFRPGPGRRQAADSRRSAAGHSRVRPGWRAWAGPRPAAGHASAGGAPARPAGRAAARRRAHPQNPWRERIPLSG
jgi:hypothetical protein